MRLHFLPLCPSVVKIASTHKGSNREKVFLPQRGTEVRHRGARRSKKFLPDNNDSELRIQNSKLRELRPHHSRFPTQATPYSIDFCSIIVKTFCFNCNTSFVVSPSTGISERKTDLDLPGLRLNKLLG